MARRKSFLQLDDERKKFVLGELVEMYIKNGGTMPPYRQIKKNPYLKMEEVDSLRRSGDYTELRIRRLAEIKIGKKFDSKSSQRIESIKATYQKKRQEACAGVVRLDEKASAKASSQTPAVSSSQASGAELQRRSPHFGVGYDEALNDLVAVIHRLGHMPTCSELCDRSNGAIYSYPTYIRCLGPKSSWAEKVKKAL